MQIDQHYISVQVAPICQRGGLSAGTTTASNTTETATTTPGTTTKRPECPYGWETYTDTSSSVKCFKYGSDTHYATDAEEACQAQGGHLASIHSREEQNFLMQTLNPENRVWIGLHRGENRAFEWTDGSTLDFIYWMSGQPDGSSKNDYVFMDCLYSPVLGEWNDLYYGQNYHYICQLTL